MRRKDDKTSVRKRARRSAASDARQHQIGEHLQPAFRHRLSGTVRLPLDECGQPARVHTFDGLPDSWIAEHDADGNAHALHPDITAGYWRAARFIEIDTSGNLPLDD